MNEENYVEYMPPPGALVAVAMSGGVDSSVTACILAERGCRVVGLTLKMFCYSDGAPDERSCCNLESIADARAVCESLGAAHYVLESSGPFREKVIDRFVSDYLAGRTPNPCVDCNTHIKFPHALARARALGAQFLATGHYARLLRSSSGEDGHVFLARGLDHSKDQSYFLWGLERERLANYCFPLGGLDKAQVRARAESLGLTVAGKRESQEVCFLAGGTVEEFIRAQDDPDASGKPGTSPGPLLDRAGNRIGTHCGAAFYTVGQRRGLGTAIGRAAYVISVDTKNNTVVVGDNPDLFSRSFEVGPVNWLVDPPVGNLTAEVKIRYRHKPVMATLEPSGQNRLRITFETPQRAVTPGQSAVFYDGQVVLGGGIIELTAP